MCVCVCVYIYIYTYIYIYIHSCVCARLCYKLCVPVPEAIYAHTMIHDRIALPSKTHKMQISYIKHAMKRLGSI